MPRKRKHDVLFSDPDVCTRCGADIDAFHGGTQRHTCSAKCRVALHRWPDKGEAERVRRAREAMGEAIHRGGLLDMEAQTYEMRARRLMAKASRKREEARKLRERADSGGEQLGLGLDEAS